MLSIHLWCVSLRSYSLSDIKPYRILVRRFSGWNLFWEVKVFKDYAGSQSIQTPPHTCKAGVENRLQQALSGAPITSWSLINFHPNPPNVSQVRHHWLCTKWLILLYRKYAYNQTTNITTIHSALRYMARFNGNAVHFQHNGIHWRIDSL